MLPNWIVGLSSPADFYYRKFAVGNEFVYFRTSKARHPLDVGYTKGERFAKTRCAIRLFSQELTVYHRILHLGISTLTMVSPPLTLDIIKTAARKSSFRLLW
jgi:hypothetical protein